MADEYDVIVVGAGVIGSAVALEAARSNRSVLVVDKGPAAGAGSTSSSSGIIRYSYSTHPTILLAWESSFFWKDWATYLGHVDPDGMARYYESGNLNFLTTGYDAAETLEAWEEIGIPFERLDPAEVSMRFGYLDVGKFYPPKPIDDPAFADDATEKLSAYYNPNSGFIDDPMLAAHNLAYAAKQEGAEFKFRSEVVAIDRDGERASGVTLASGESIRAKYVINVGGPHSSIVNRFAGVADTMTIGHRALRNEVYTAPAPNGFVLEDGTGPVISDLDVGQYMKPQLGDQILVGGTEPECDEMHWIDDPDDFRELPTVEQWETSMYRMARRMPDFGVPHSPTGLAALYDVSDDWVPIYDKSDLDGYLMACGTSGNQFKNAPLAGKFMVALLDAADAGIDHDVDPVCFVGEQTGREIPLATFSRNRDKTSTTGTVMG